MNFLEQLSQFKPIPESQVHQLQNDFESAITNPHMVVEIFRALHAYFVQINFDPQFIIENYATYWRWYARSAWKSTLILREDEFLVVFPKQFVLAIIHGVTVEDRLLEFMQYKIIETKEVQTFYKTIRSLIFADNTPITPENYTISQLVSDLRGLSLKTDLEQAEYLSKLERGIFAREVWEFSSEEKGRIIGSIIYFVDFLAKTEDISEIYEGYLASYLNDHDSDIEPSEEVETRPELPVEKAKSIEPPKPNYSKIYQDISSTYNTEDMDQALLALTELQRLSQMYGDPAIEELLYYDERDQKFVWNTKLLAEE